MLRRCPPGDPGRTRRPRPAFTLVEILVVIFIVTVLVGLTTYYFSFGSRVAENLVAASEVPELLVGKKAPAVQKFGRSDFGFIPNQFIVVLKGGADPRTEAARLGKDVDLKVLSYYTGVFRGFAVNASGSAAAYLRNDPAVASLQQDRIYRGTGQVIPTGVTRVGFNLSSQKSGDGFMPTVLSGIPGKNTGRGTVRGMNVVIAIMDSGVDPTHPDLNVERAVAFGYPTPDDEHGHGTHVAGIAAALDNGLGVVGAAPGARIWNLRVLGPNNSGPTSGILAALDYVYQNAASIQVLNMSLGGPGVDPILNAAVEACVARGVVVCVAAGNSNQDAGTFSPASAPNAITVAALADSDGVGGGQGPKTSAGADDTFATFSNWGAVCDVIAPGVDILSTKPGNQYQVFSGTSQATPYVSGLAALIRNGDARVGIGMRNARSKFNNPNYTPANVLQLMLQQSNEVILGPGGKAYPLINGRAF